MKGSLRSVLLFAVQFPFFFLPLLAIYPTMMVPYDKLVTRLAGTVLSQVSPRVRIASGPDADWRLEVSDSATGLLRSARASSDRTRLVYVNIVLLPALLLATPVHLRRRVGMLSLGVFLLLVAHVISVACFAYTWGRFCGEPTSAACRHLGAMLSPGGQAIAVSIWGLLTWRDWVRPQLSA